MVGCFLTPSTKSEYTYPADLKYEIDQVANGYVLDVEDFRTDDKDRLLSQIYEMTDKRFKVARHLSTTRDWDFFMFVEMGTDRIHHGLWKYTDPEHPKYVPGNPYENCIRDYYLYLDTQIGRMMEIVDDHTVVMVVSDHGAKRMDGGICMNEWLIHNGFLALKATPDRPVSLDKAEVDWTRTTAWGSGGYYGRLFMNVRGREPDGVIEPEQYEPAREQLIRQLESIVDPGGHNIGTRAYKPQEIYREVRGIAPDLIVYFGNLNWRSVGTVGSGNIYTFENDTGPDDANHAQHGIFIMYDPKHKGRGRLNNLHITDCAPTALQILGEQIPADMIGKIIL
jgi:predicted AlkP superfamily phosphohydrolase/phosphomutase